MLGLGRLALGPAGRGHARGILHIFRLAEVLMERGRVAPLLTPQGWLRYEVTRLYTHALPLPGEPPVRRGDPVIIVHFDNRRVAALAAQAASTHQLTWRLARAADEDMAALADLIRAGQFAHGPRAVWVEGLFAPALRRYGFATRPSARRLRAPWARLFLLALVAIYSRDGLRRLDDERLLRLPMTEAWIGLDELQRRLPSTHGADAPDKDAAERRADGRAQEEGAVAGRRAVGGQRDQDGAAEQRGDGLRQVGGDAPQAEVLGQEAAVGEHVDGQRPIDGGVDAQGQAEDQPETQHHA